MSTELEGRIEAILDGGPCRIGLESTVLDLTAKTPRILRQGPVTAEQLQRILGEFVVADPHTSFDLPKGLPSPGMMSCHYRRA